MDRRSFLKMFFSFLLFPCLPKAKAVKEPEQSDYVPGVDPGQGDDYTVLTAMGWWNVALTDGEIAALANGISPMFIRPENSVSFSPPAPEGYFDIRTSPVRRSRGRPFPTIVSLPKELTDASDV